MVTNEQGSCLIRTTDSAIANFVNQHSRGIPPNMFLVVGGDPGTRSGNQKPHKIFHHIRKVSR